MLSSPAAQQRKGEYPPFKRRLWTDADLKSTNRDAQQRKGEYPPFKTELLAGSICGYPTGMPLNKGRESIPPSRSTVDIRSTEVTNIATLNKGRESIPPSSTVCGCPFGRQATALNKGRESIPPSRSGRL